MQRTIVRFVCYPNAANNLGPPMECQTRRQVWSNPEGRGSRFRFTPNVTRIGCATEFNHNLIAVFVFHCLCLCHWSSLERLASSCICTTSTTRTNERFTRRARGDCVASFGDTAAQRARLKIARPAISAVVCLPARASSSSEVVAHAKFTAVLALPVKIYPTVIVCTLGAGVLVDVVVRALYLRTL